MWRQSLFFWRGSTTFYFYKGPYILIKWGYENETQRVSDIDIILRFRFNRVGLYVVMFLEILSTLLRVVMVFSVLIIAFGLSFHILLARVELSTKRAIIDPNTGNITMVVNVSFRHTLS